MQVCPDESAVHDVPAAFEDAGLTPCNLDTTKAGTFNITFRVATSPVSELLTIQLRLLYCLVWLLACRNQ